MQPTGSIHTADYLKRIGVPDIPAATSPFDPGYDPVTVEGHLQQSFHLMPILKISMAGWIVANKSSTRRKIALARRYGVPTVTGGGPFEIAVAQGELPAVEARESARGVGLFDQHCNLNTAYADRFRWPEVQ